MHRKASLFALLISAAAMTGLYACVGDDPSGGSTSSDGDSGGGGGGTDGMVMTDGNSPGEASVDGGPGVDAADAACVTATGKFLGAKTFPFVATNQSVVGTSDGGYVFVGDFRNMGTYGDAGVITGNGNTMDAVAVRFNADGSLKWQAHFGGTGSETFQGVTVDDKNDVYVTGYFSSASFTIGSRTFTNASGANLGIVAKLDGSNGNAVWAHPFSPGYLGFGCSAIDFDSGRLVASCSMGATQVYEDGASTTKVLTGPGQPAEASVYGLDPATGYVVWASALGVSTADMNTVTYVSTIDVTPMSTVIAGEFMGGSLTEKPSNAITVAQLGTKSNGFVTELSIAAPIAPLWAKGFGDASGAGQVNRASAAGASATGILVGGSFTGTIDFGLGPHASVGGQDGFVMMLRNKAGAAAWDKYFGGAADDTIGKVIYDRCGRGEALMLTYSTLAATDGVTMPAPQAGGVAGIVGKLDPKDGKLFWASGITPGGNPDLNGINQYDFGVDLAGNTLVVGNFRGAVDFGSGTPSVAVGGSDPFVVGYGP